MKEFCIDTDIAIDFLRGKKYAADAFALIEKVEAKAYVSSITVFELSVGAFLSADITKSLEAMRL